MLYMKKIALPILEGLFLFAKFHDEMYFLSCEIVFLSMKLVFFMKYIYTKTS